MGSEFELYMRNDLEMQVKELCVDGNGEVKVSIEDMMHRIFMKGLEEMQKYKKKKGVRYLRPNKKKQKEG